RAQSPFLPPSTRRRFYSVASEGSTSFFRRQGGDDLLEAWITAERVPVGMQAQLSVANQSRMSQHCSQLLNREVFLPRPSISYGKVFLHNYPIHGILGRG